MKLYRFDTSDNNNEKLKHNLIYGYIWTDMININTDRIITNMSTYYQDVL